MNFHWKMHKWWLDAHQCSCHKPVPVSSLYLHSKTGWWEAVICGLSACEDEALPATMGNQGNQRHTGKTLSRAIRGIRRLLWPGYLDDEIPFLPLRVWKKRRLFPHSSRALSPLLKVQWLIVFRGGVQGWGWGVRGGHSLGCHQRRQIPGS